MKLIGFGFKKISITKKKQDLKDLKIETNIAIPDVRKIKDSLIKSDDDLLEFDFEYTVNYTPEIAEISLGGTLVLAVENTISKEILKNWKKKKLPDNVRVAIFNVVLKKSNIKALNLEEEMNLPYHLPLPQLKPAEEENN
tara:strand:- start:102 stop:521 length:420 start_codon:yes stop_codon:yes gene_type:complete